MSALIWNAPTEDDLKTTPSLLAQATPSEKTTYLIIDIGDGEPGSSVYSFCRVLIGARGAANSAMGDMGITEEVAKQICQSDWDSGQRP